MRYPTIKIRLLLVASGTIITAQNATAAEGAVNTNSTKYCAQPELVDRCVAVMKSNLAACRSDDWNCKCTGITNVANCYEECTDDPAFFAADLSRQKTCATADAYDIGQTSVPTTWTTAGAMTTETTTTGVGSKATATTTGDGPSSTGGPTDTASPSKGAAAVKDVGNLLAFLEVLGLWILV